MSSHNIQKDLDESVPSPGCRIILQVSFHSCLVLSVEVRAIFSMEARSEVLFKTMKIIYTKTDVSSEVVNQCYLLLLKPSVCIFFFQLSCV